MTSVALLSFAPLLVVALVALVVSHFHSRLQPQIASRMLMTILVLAAFSAIPVLVELIAGALFEVPLAGIWFHDEAHAQGFHVNIGQIVAIFVWVGLLLTVIKGLRVIRSYYRSHLTSGAELIVVDDKRPFAFATPGPSGEIAVSSALVEMLSHPEFEVVLAHERAHRHGRHDRLLLVGNICTFLFPLLRPVLRRLEFSLERIADNCAVKISGSRELVAHTLAKVAMHDDLPVLTMGISKVGVAARVVSLINGPVDITRRNLALMWMSVFLLLPLALLQWHHVVSSLRLACGV